MGFKKFLIEKSSSRHELTYQKLLIAIDDAHVSKGENFYEFNLGAVVDDSTLSKLFVRVQKSDNMDVKLGSFKDGRGKVIVVYTDKLPSRKEIDTLLSTNKAIMAKFISALNKFSSEFVGDSTEDVKMTKREKLASHDPSEDFEENYEKLIDAVENKKKEYDMVVAELDKDEEVTVNQLKKASIKAAKDKLNKEFFGNSEEEFVKAVLKMAEAQFVKSVDKELQDKLKNRLENYYQQKF